MPFLTKIFKNGEFMEENRNNLVYNGKKICNYIIDNVAKNIIYNEREIGYDEAIEIGIEKTITSLYEANVKEEKIKNIVSKQWNVVGKELDKRLNYVKNNMTINALKEYLEEQGYSDNRIQKMFIEKKVGIIIRHDKKLWELRDNPEKLYRKFFD